MDSVAAVSRALLDLHREMLYIRAVEQGIVDRYGEQEMRCPVHLSIGQEATAVGVCQALQREDRVYSTHRCHAHYLAKGGNLKAMLAEIYGKAAGCIGGRGGSMHLMDLDVGMFISVPIVASSIPLAVGGALADKMARLGRVNVVFIGDASVEEGVFHESANFAGLHKLPVIFVCENNLYSVYTPLSQRQPARPLANVAVAHGIPAETADGNDVEAVHAAAQTAVARARQGGGPTFLVFDTYRWREHCGPNFDNNIGYRSEAEYEEWRRRDPIARAAAKLGKSGALDDKAVAKIDAELKKLVDEAFDFAKSAPLPLASSAGDHIYA
jgi:TPP-dependent pyruvate/acetoin dehydrogenase alpha subunit